MGGPSKKQKQKQTRSYLFSSSLEQTVNIQNKAASSSSTITYYYCNNMILLLA